jgi:Uma2 family endonuclease
MMRSPMMAGALLRLPDRRAERMGMPAPLEFYTREMVLALPEDGNRYETVWGELLVTPSPRVRHQVVLMRLVEELAPYLRREPVGLLLASPADISWGPDILVQPDLFVIAKEQAGARDWPEITRLELVVEVLSPLSARADRFTKRRLYQAQGVGTYWVVDAEAHKVEVWTPGAALPRIETERVRWRPAGAGEGLEIELAELFREG